MPLVSVAELVQELQALPDQDAPVYLSQEDDERAFRVGGPYLTTDGDVVLSHGAIFIDDFEEVDEDED